jgi:hypothetical protein
MKNKNTVLYIAAALFNAQNISNMACSIFTHTVLTFSTRIALRRIQCSVPFFRPDQRVFLFVFVVVVVSTVSTTCSVLITIRSTMYRTAEEKNSAHYSLGLNMLFS